MNMKETRPNWMKIKNRLEVKEKEWKRIQKLAEYHVECLLGECCASERDS